MESESFVRVNSRVSELRERVKEIHDRLGLSDYKVRVKAKKFSTCTFVELIITNKYYRGATSVVVMEIIKQLEPFGIRGASKGLKFIFDMEDLVRRLRRK